MQNISRKIAFSTLMLMPILLFSEPLPFYKVHQVVEQKKQAVVQTVLQVKTHKSTTHKKTTHKKHHHKKHSTKTPSSYSKFQSGVITPKRLAKYIRNWSKYKPKGVKGRLVIVQAGATSDGRFLRSNGKNVVTYQIPAGGSCDPSYVRHDGVSNIPGAMITGDKMDGMINAFHLDPKKDFVVFAVGKGSTSMREVVRSAWSLIYWGWSKKDWRY